MDLNKEEYDIVSELMERYAYTYGNTFEKKDMRTANLKVNYKGHEMMLSYVYGNSRIFIIDEWDCMKTINTVTNIASLPERMKVIVEDWKEKVNEVA